jgi:Domain of unknown function (DUF1330)
MFVRLAYGLGGGVVGLELFIMTVHWRAPMPKGYWVASYEIVEKAIAAYESPAYQAALALLKDACVREVRIVPGVDKPT